MPGANLFSDFLPEQCGEEVFIFYFCIDLSICLFLLNEEECRVLKRFLPGLRI